MGTLFDTIAAVATPYGSGGVAVIRVSGSRAIEIGEKVCRLSEGKALSALEPRCLTLGEVLDAEGNVLDQALFCVMRAPNSFTGEDVVEIHCHGGLIVVRAIIRQLNICGARQAEAGEFTRRGFLNGKISLTQAEAIADIIDAKTDKALILAASQLGGALSDKVELIRGRLLNIATHLLAVIDFPEDGIEEITLPKIRDGLNFARQEIKKLLKTAVRGKIISAGLNVALVGAPNVGKSSILNLLLGEDRAIVTDVEGTTRDALKERANINGCLVNLIDTAGIRDTDDVVESIGVERSRKHLQEADLAVVVLDCSRELSMDDREILEATDGRARIILANKADLPKIMEPVPGAIYSSARTGEGMEEFCRAIVEFCGGQDAGEPLVTNDRQEAVLAQALGSVEAALNALDDSGAMDLILGELEVSLALLGQMDGQEVCEEMLGQLFSRFCVGK